MGFLNKLWNWVRGKGYKEQPEEEEYTQTRQELEAVEQTQYPQEQQQEQTQEIQTEETKQTKEKPQPQQPHEQEMQKFRENLRTKPSKKEIEQKIDREQVNKINIQTTLTDIGELKPLYKQIFTDNAKLTDPDILNVLIENRRQLQHRFEATFKIYDKNGLAGELRTAGIIIEQANSIYKFLQIGKETDYLKEDLEAAQSYFEQNYGAIGGNVNVRRNEKVKITDIQIDVTYA